jgi:DNA topoisomerase I
MQTLLIVESPTKAVTLKKFLGKEYEVQSSLGHIRDLPKDKIGIDVEHDFTPSYIIPTKARKTVTSLKKLAEKAKEVILASDEDREGEAIAWHIAQVLGLKDSKRIVFHEITKDAITEALEHPRTIDMNRVNAQQARRILDRLVGYNLSPFLWKKIARGLSAGRVQSVAVRLVSDREREIQAFKPQEYWSIEAVLEKEKKEFQALLIKKGKEAISKLTIKTQQKANNLVKDLQGAEYRVEKIEKREMRSNPLPPFMTSTLQQEASKKLRFTAKATMSVAQHLYETGFITYHRTDSVNLSAFSLQAAKIHITNTYGKEYWPGSPRIFKGKSKGAQEAHEAIRPTYPAEFPESLKVQKKLDPRSSKLYDLIWRRFMASQMSQAILDLTKAEISAKDAVFASTGQTLKFDGFLKVYPMKFEEKELPALQKEDSVNLLSLNPLQHFTQPPARFTEASLVKALEEHGIGRPSTYAPILSTIQERGYIEKDEQRRFKPTELGFTVNDVLVQHFPQIVDISFTADMEEKLDKIAQGEKEWVPTMKEFYQPFAENLKKKYEEVVKKDIITETTDKTCPTCGAPLIVRMGRFGKFYACSTFPKCRYTENMQKEKMSLGIACPSCKKGEIVRKLTRTRRTFYGCNTYPACTFALWQKPTGKNCEKCNSLLVETGKDPSKSSGQADMKCSNKTCETNKS